MIVFFLLGLSGCMNSSSVQEYGLRSVIELIEEKVDGGSPDFCRLIEFTGELNSETRIGDFRLTAEGYDSQKQSTGVFLLVRTGRRTVYTAPAACSSKQTLSKEYDEAEDLTYISNQFRRLPIREQMAVDNVDTAKISSAGWQCIPQGDPVIDVRNGMEIPARSWDEYWRGYNGYSDGEAALVLSLSIPGQGVLNYLCPSPEDMDKNAAQAASIPLRCHSRVTEQGELQFSGDYEKTWITCDMTPAQVKSALDIYSGGKLPPGEYYISESKPYIIAFLYGEEPQLYITRNGGSTWESYPIPLGTSLSGLGYSGRAVRFFDEQNGYAAIGTGWSMGRGGLRMWRVTHDGGRTWQEQESMHFPESESHCLTGISFIDFEHGVISLQGPSDDQALIYTTSDGGATWCEQDLGELHGYVLNLEEEDGRYTFNVRLIQYQNPITFESTAMDSGWKCVTAEE